jgi:hypothetical protein
LPRILERERRRLPVQKSDAGECTLRERGGRWPVPLSRSSGVTWRLRRRSRALLRVRSNRARSAV